MRIRGPRAHPGPVRLYIYNVKRMCGYEFQATDKEELLLRLRGSLKVANGGEKSYNFKFAWAVAQLDLTWPNIPKDNNTNMEQELVRLCGPQVYKCYNTNQHKTLTFRMSNC